MSVPDSDLSSSPYTSNDVARILIDDYGKKKVAEALDHIFTTDSRFNESGDDTLQHTLRDLVLVPEESVKGKSVKKKSKKSRVEPKLIKQVTTLLSGLLHRPPTQVDFQSSSDSPSTQSCTMEQIHGHVEEGSFLPGYTVSSDLQKLKPGIAAIANHGVILFKKNEQSSVLLSRSGRTDSTERIEQKSIADIRMRLASKTRDGLEQIGEPLNVDGHVETTYRYRRKDITFLDKSIIKTAITRLATLGKNYSQDESLFINNKERAIEELWNQEKNKKVQFDEQGEPYLERRVMMDDQSVAIVREYKPELVNYVFSSEAKRSVVQNNVKEARENNLAVTLKNCQRLLELPEMGNTGLRQLALGYIDQLLTEKRTRNQGERESTISLLVLLLDQLVASTPPLPIKQRIGLQGIRIALLGVDQEGNRYDNAQGSAVQFAYENVINDLLKMPTSIECKSGNDRTASAMAIACAQKEYEEVNEQPFDPRTMGLSGSREMQVFSDLFLKYISAFAAPTVIASRGLGEGGKAKLKTKASPIFQLFLKNASPALKAQVEGQLDIC